MKERFGPLHVFTGDARLDHEKIQPYLLCDALALMRKVLWAQATFRMSVREPETVKVPRGFVEHLTETLCHAP